MKDDITDLYFSQEPICEEGRLYLADRHLSIPEAYKRGVCSKDGMIYFVYFRDGEIVRWKARSMQDKKQQFMSKLQAGEETNFRMPVFSRFKAPPLRDLFVTEGEFDCIALSQLGALNCVSIPNGASSVEKAFRDNYEFLQEFEVIYICFDMDKAGEEAAKKAMSMLSPGKFRRICFPCKDANEWLMKNPELEYADLEKLMENSRRVENPCLVDVMELPLSYYEPIDKGISSGWEKLDNILLGIRVGEVTVITADTGAGKTTFCINLFKNLADQGKGIWLNSYEMDPIMVNRKLASIVLKKQMKLQAFSDVDLERYRSWLKDKNCLLNVANSKVDAVILRDLFEKASLAYGVKYILLDHLDYIHAGGKKSTLENIDDAVREIHSLAMEFKVGVVLVVHPRQAADAREIGMHDLKGSASIKQYADNILAITKMERLDPNDHFRIKIRVWKNRLTGKENFFYLWYVPEIDGYTEHLDVFR